MANDITISILAEVQKATRAIETFSQDTQRQFEKVEKTTGKVNQSVEDLRSGFLKLGSVAKIGGVIAAGFATLKGVSSVIQDSIDAAVKFENAIRGVSSVSEALGINSREIVEAVKELSSDGLIPLAKIADSFKNLLSTGIGLPDAIKLFKSLKDAAIENKDSQTSLEDAVLSATEGFKKSKTSLIQAALATANLDKYQLDYAVSIGKTVSQLTKKEKIQASLNGILKDAAKFNGAAAKFSNTYQGATERLNDSFESLSVSVGLFFTQNTKLIALKNALSNFIEGVAKGLDLIRELFNQNTDAIREFGDMFIFLGKVIEDKLGKVFGKNLFGALGEEIKKYADDLDFAADEIDTLTDSQNKLNKALSSEVDPEAIAGILKSYEELQAQIIKSTNTEIENLNILKRERLKIVEDAVNAQIKTEEDGKKIRILIEKDYQKSLAALADKEKKEYVDKLKAKAEATRKFNEDMKNIRDSVLSQVQNIGQDPLNLLFNFQGDVTSFETTLTNLTAQYEAQNIALEDYQAGLDAVAAEYEKFKQAKVAAAIGGTLSMITKGADGARQMVSGLAKGIANAAIPGLGEALGPLFDAFTQGPEAVKGMVTEFTNSLPIVIQGFVEAIPAFIEALVENIPILLDAFIGIIDSLVEKAPMIIESIIDKLPLLVSSIISRLPEIAIKLAIALATTVPAEIIKRIPEIVGALISGIASGLGQLFENLINQIKDFLGDPVGSVGDFFGFAQGGQAFNVTGGVSGRDSVPALLTPGELVVDRSTAFALKDFLANQGTNDYDLVVASKLANIEELLKNPQIISGDVNIGYSVLSEAILKLNRSNARLA